VWPGARSESLSHWTASALTVVRLSAFTLLATRAPVVRVLLGSLALLVVLMAVF
jgi:hypothetical protein